MADNQNQDKELEILDSRIKALQARKKAREEDAKGKQLTDEFVNEPVRLAISNVIPALLQGATGLPSEITGPALEGMRGLLEGGFQGRGIAEAAPAPGVPAGPQTPTPEPEGRSRISGALDFLKSPGFLEGALPLGLAAFGGDTGLAAGSGIAKGFSKERESRLDREAKAKQKTLIDVLLAQEGIAPTGDTAKKGKGVTFKEASDLLTQGRKKGISDEDLRASIISDPDISKEIQIKVLKLLETAKAK